MGGLPPERSATVLICPTVMTHPVRLDDAKSVAAKLGIDDVVIDPEPDGPPSPLRTSALAWKSTSAKATHRLVVQDDIEAPPNFLELARIAIERRPRAAISYYTSWDSRNGSAVRLAALTGAGLVRAVRNEWTPSVALVLPAALGHEFARYAEKATGFNFNDDTCMRAFLTAADYPSYLTVPNIVEHTGDLTISGKQGHGMRKAACYIVGQLASSSLTGGHIMEGIDFLPHFASDQGRAVVDITDDGISSSEITGFREVRTLRWRKAIERLDIDEDFILTSYGTFIATPQGHLVVDECGTRSAFLRELWAHAFLVGSQAGRMAAANAALVVDMSVGSTVPTTRVEAVSNLDIANPDIAVSAIQSIAIGSVVRTERALLPPSIRTALETLCWAAIRTAYPTLAAASFNSESRNARQLSVAGDHNQ